MFFKKKKKTKTILRYEGNYLLYPVEVDPEHFEALKQEAGDSHAVIYFDHESKMGGETHVFVKLSFDEVDYVVEDKDGHFYGFYVLEKEERGRKFFKYPETLVDINGEFGFRENASGPQDEWEDDEEVYLIHDSKHVKRENPKPLKCVQKQLFDRGAYFDELPIITSEKKLHRLDLDITAMAHLSVEAMFYALLKEEGKEVCLLPTLNDVMKNEGLQVASFPILNRESNALEGFLIRSDEGTLCPLLFKGKNDSPYRLVKMKEPPYLQSPLKCPKGADKPSWEEIK